MLEDERVTVTPSPSHVTEVVPPVFSASSTTLIKHNNNLVNKNYNKIDRLATQFMNRPNVQNGLATTNNQFNSHRNNNNNGNTTITPNNNFSYSPGEGRPPFVTTVTRGRFLPSKFDLMVERSLYTFSSRPRPVGLTITRHQCSLAGGGGGDHKTTPRGIHDYFNVMWDPHVQRGIPSRALESEEVQAKRTSENGGGVKVRKKRSSNMTRSRYKVHQSRGTPPPFEGRYHNVVQTDTYLEDLTLDIADEDVAEADANVQTDPVHDYPLSPPPCQVIEKTGIDASTQIIPGELSNFDEELEPIIATLVQKILEQALMETMEDEELAALKEQQNRFLEKKRREEKELMRLQEQHQRIAEERELLKKHLESQSLNSVVQDSVKFQSTSSTGGPVFTTEYLLELLPSVLSSLRQEGFLNDTIGDPDTDTLSAAFPPDNNNIKSKSPTTEEEEENPGDGLVLDEDGEGDTNTQTENTDDTEVEKEQEGAIDEIVARKTPEQEKNEGGIAEHEDNETLNNSAEFLVDERDAQQGEVQEGEGEEGMEAQGGVQEQYLTSETMENEK